MAHLIRGLIFVLAAPAVGYVLMIGVSPSEDEARRKLKQNDPASERIRQQNQALMKQLQKQAGITDEQLKKK